MVLTTIADGTIIVPTQPSSQVLPPPTTPTGLIGVDPNTGAQTKLCTNDMIGSSFFSNPQEVVEAPGRIGVSAPSLTPQLFVADGAAGTNGQGAVIEYDPNQPISQSNPHIVADSSNGGLINDPTALAFLNGYLYVANCAAHTLVRLDPNNGWAQSYVTVNGMTSGFFMVVTDLKHVQGNTNALYLLDEGGFIRDAGAGQVWQLTFSDSLTATRTAYGPQFPTSPDYRHPQGLTADLSNPSSADPLVVSAAIGGKSDTLVVVHPSSFEVLNQSSYVYAADGLAMGSSQLYGSNTIFVPLLASGSSPNITPAQVSAINRLAPSQAQALQYSIGGNLSGVTGPTIYYSSGGQAAAPPGRPQAPVLVPVTEDQRYDAGLITQQTLLSEASSNPEPSTSPMVLLPQASPLGGAEEPRLGTARATATDQLSMQNEAVDSFFADWVGERSLTAFSPLSKTGRFQSL